MIASYYNLAVEAVALSVSSENYNFPKANLQDTTRWTKYRTLYLTGQWIKMNAPASAASHLFIDNHNVTSDATITLEANDTDSWTSPSFSETVTWDAGMMMLFFTEETYNYWRLKIDYATNPDGYIEIGLLHLGPVVQFPGMEPAQSLPYSSESKKTISPSRQVYGDIRASFREFEVAFKHVTNLQRLNINTLYGYCQNVRPMFLLPWEDALDFEPPMYCVIADKTLKWKRNNNPRYPWGVSIKFEEVF